MLRSRGKPATSISLHVLSLFVGRMHSLTVRSGSFILYIFIFFSRVIKEGDYILSMSKN